MQTCVVVEWPGGAELPNEELGPATRDALQVLQRQLVRH